MSVFDTWKITNQLRSQGSAGEQGSLEAGATLQGRYLILGILGVGGMGSVYQARDLHFPNVTKLVAVKEMINLAPDPVLRDMIVRNFEREANILATLSHPAIPEIYDYFTDNDRSYLVLEFINGKDLETVLNEAPGFLPEADVVKWTMQLCEVLSYLHEHKPQPIVFRDMKPSNVMLDHHGNIRLIDFGIAKGFQAGQKGTMIGTEGYSPPEQYRGEASPSGDIYALGATLHHLLTKQDPRLEPPFSFTERPIRKLNPDVSPELEALVMTSLAYNANERFPTAQAMRDALARLNAKNESPDLTTQFLAGQSGLIRATGGPTGMLAAGSVMPMWEFKCEDEVRGSPAVEGGLVYVGAYDNNVYALDAGSGKFQWKYATEGGLAASPAVHQGLLFVGSEDRRLYCLNAKSGRLNWSYYADGPIRCNPSIAHEHIFFGSDDTHLHAVNIQTGRRVWRAETGAAVRSTPAIGTDRIYVGCESGELYSLDFSGAIKWRFRAKRAITSGPAVAEGLVFVGSMDWSIYALEAASGWSVWRYRTNKPVISSGCINRNTLYIGSADGSLYAFEANSGKVRWKFETEGQVNSSPLYYSDAVYFGSVDGYVYSLEAGSGLLRWKFKTGGPVTSSPAVANGLIYVGSTDHKLYAFSA
jgi:outer membrane protein assembly factor BamB